MLLTDPTGPGFARLAADVFTPDMRIRIHRRAVARWEREQEQIVIETNSMTLDEVERLMRSDIPAAASTRRRSAIVTDVLR